MHAVGIGMGIDIADVADRELIALREPYVGAYIDSLLGESEAVGKVIEKLIVYLGREWGARLDGQGETQAHKVVIFSLLDLVILANSGRGVFGDGDFTLVGELVARTEIEFENGRPRLELELSVEAVSEPPIIIYDVALGGRAAVFILILKIITSTSREELDRLELGRSAYAPPVEGREAGASAQPRVDADVPFLRDLKLRVSLGPNAKIGLGGKVGRQ